MSLQLQPVDPAEVAGWRADAVARRAPLHATPLTGDAAAGEGRVRATLARIFPADGDWNGAELLRLVDGAERVGLVALAWDNPTAAFVCDLVLERSEDAVLVRAAIEARAAAAGAESLGIRVAPGDPAATAFASDPAFAVVATNLVLDLTTAADRVAGDDQPPVGLRAMSPTAVDAYLDSSVEEFAAETRQADATLGHEDSLVSARRLYAQLLPDGPGTEGHEFLDAVDGSGRAVGMTWLFHEGVAGFVYDVVVGEEHRGRGFGRALMTASADRMREHGLAVLGLNVFGHNAVARHLYDALGYRIVDEVRVKPL